MKTIGVLTSGGDAPGMNAAVRAVVRSAIAKGIKVMGVSRGYDGLIEGRIEELKARSVSDIIHRGGTVLFSARSPEFKTAEGVDKAVAVCKKFGIEGLVIIGGDGSFRGAAELSAKGIPCIGVPATIDNDISSTDYSIGFDTAMNTAVEMIDKLRDTAQSHERCFVIEVMGRHAGHLALETGIAVGATAILVPEVKCTLEEICKKIERLKQNNKKHFSIVVAEGYDIPSDAIAKVIQSTLGIATRSSILGHIQRGGNPTVRDRVMASLFANAAVELLAQGKGNRVVASKNNEILDYDIMEALSMKKEFKYDRYVMAETLAI